MEIIFIEDYAEYKYGIGDIRCNLDDAVFKTRGADAKKDIFYHQKNTNHNYYSI